MLRFWLLGGVRPTIPWELLITLGSALVLAGGMFVFLFPLWTTYPVVGVFETAIFVALGGALLAIGAARRARSTKRR